jgi:hypothetical protein
LIYGYDYEDWPMELAVAAFEQLARERVQLGTRNFASFDGLFILSIGVEGCLSGRSNASC